MKALTGVEKEKKGTQRGGTPYGNRPILLMQETFYLCHSQLLPSSTQEGGRGTHTLLCSTFLWKQTAIHSALQETSHILSTCLQHYHAKNQLFLSGVCFFLTPHIGWSHVLVAVSAPECTCNQISYWRALSFTIEDMKEKNEGILHSD